MLKKLTSLLLAVCMLFCLSACGTTETSSNPTTNTLSKSQTDTVEDNDENTFNKQNGQVTSNTEETNKNESTQTQTQTNQSKPTSTTNQPTHTHSYSNATCTSPKKCSCGVTAGTALGHQFSSATCTSPKICSRCGIASGNALGHNYSAANCNSPKTCTRCGQTSGSALGHNYVNNKCSRCGKNDPNAIAYLYDMDMFNSDNAENQRGLYDSFGNHYDKSIHMGSATQGWGMPEEGIATYYLNGKYSTISGTVAYEDYYLDADWHIDYNINIYVYADEELVYSKKNISKWTEPFEFNANIKNCKFLKINVISEGPDICYLILSDLKVEK